MNAAEQYIHIMYIILPLSRAGNLEKNTLSLSNTEVMLVRRRKKKDSLLPGQRPGGHQ